MGRHRIVLALVFVGLSACRVNCGRGAKEAGNTPTPREWEEADAARLRQSVAFEQAWRGVGASSSGPGGGVPVAPGPALGAAAGGLGIGTVISAALIRANQDAGSPLSDERAKPR
jgi:hypothetical protein